MSLRLRMGAALLGITLCGSVVTRPIWAQAKANEQHVVTQEELNSDAARPGETRQSNEAELRHLLSSEMGQQALKSAEVSYEKVDKAVGQLSDEDLARLAERSRQAENDFAAGLISAKTLAYIILILVVVIVIIVLV